MKKILFLKWDSFGNEFIEKEWKELGYQVEEFQFPQKNEDTRGSEELATRIAQQILNEKIDVCFSFNYFATAAIACKACKIPYLSWTYDSPYIQLYSKTIEYDTNRAFVFDSSEYLRLKKLGIDTVYYLPMAAPVDLYDSMQPSEQQYKKYKADIAMIGSMYSEKKHQLYRHLEQLDDYTKGYLDAVISAQKGIYGASVLESSLTPEIVKKMQKVCPMTARGDGLESIEWVFSNYFLARRCTAEERFEILRQLSEEFEVALYTPEKTPHLPKVDNRGKVDYYTEAPYAMKCAKINLNITLRSIVAGIPLRAMDILGCGGFLMTNYQDDFLEYFEPDKEFVYYDSIKDLKEKIRYYLAHDKEREEIALRGHKKMLEYHTYHDRVKTMMEHI